MKPETPYGSSSHARSIYYLGNRATENLGISWPGNKQLTLGSNLVGTEADTGMLQAGQPSHQSRVEPATWAAALSICFNTCSGRFRLWSRATSARAGSLFCPLCPSSGEPGTCQRWQTCTSNILDAVVVLVHFSCCKELPQTMWLIDSGGLFSQCWRLGGSRPEHQQAWCVVRTYLLNLAQTFLCKFTQQKGKDDL